jgi:hypothetical protein
MGREGQAWAKAGAASAESSNTRRCIEKSLSDLARPLHRSPRAIAQACTTTLAAPATPTHSAPPKEIPMPSLRTTDGVDLHYEDVGEGTPMVFVHEYAGDHRAWEAQLRFFARR